MNVKILILYLLIFIFFFTFTGCNKENASNPVSDTNSAVTTATVSPSGEMKRKEGMTIEDFFKAAAADTFGEKISSGTTRVLKVDIYSDNTMIDVVLIADPNKDNGARIKDMEEKSIEFFKYIAGDKEVQALKVIYIRCRENDKDMKNIFSTGFKGEKLKGMDWNSVNADNLKTMADDYFVDPSLTI